jgi:hypothetical protein
MTSKLEGGSRLTGGPAGVEQLTLLFQQAQNPNRDKRDEAFHELYQYVAGQMKSLVAGYVRRQLGGPFQVTEALHDAIGTLFLKWSELQVKDTSHFRALVVQAVYWKVSKQRRANRRLRAAITQAATIQQQSGGNLDALERFEEAVEKLAEFELARHIAAGRPDGVSPTPRADVVKARHLIGLEAAAGVQPSIPTFEAIGQTLNIKAPAACKLYWAALEWLHENYPDIVPSLPERKKTGRKKLEGGNGGAS